jgi:hypothetical protein
MKFKFYFMVFWAVTLLLSGRWVATFCFHVTSLLKMELVFSLKMLIPIYQTTQYENPEIHNLNLHHRKVNVML